MLGLDMSRPRSGARGALAKGAGQGDVRACGRLHWAAGWATWTAKASTGAQGEAATGFVQAGPICTDWPDDLYIAEKDVQKRAGEAPARCAETGRHAIIADV
jgi:hypothetical protein